MRTRSSPFALLLLAAAIPCVAACGDRPTAPAAQPPKSPAAAVSPAPAAATQAAATVLPATRATKSGRIFSVELHMDVGAGAPSSAARAAADALTAAELAADRFASLIGETPGRLGLAFTAERGGPVTIHVWPDATTAAAAVSSAPGTTNPDTHVANSHEVTGTVRTPAPSALHVALTPPLPPMAFDEVGLPAQTVRAIVRAVAPVLRARRFPDAAAPPRWIADGEAEGLAGYVDGYVWATAAHRAAPTGSRERLTYASPVETTMTVRLMRLLERGALPSAADVMAGRVTTLDDADLAAVHVSLHATLVAALGDRPPRALYPVATSDGIASPGDSTPPDIAALMSAAGAADLDHVWRERIAAAKPAGWDCPARAISQLPGDRDWLLIGGPDRPDAPQTIAWRLGDDRDTSLAISGRVSILLGSRSGSVARVLFGRRDDGCLAVEFGPGTLALVRCDASTRTVTTIAAIDRPILRPGQTIQFEVVIIQGRVAVFVDGKETLTKDIEASSVTGAWGLGVTSGSAVAWRGLSSGR
ncbi:MAG: hypothetical protein K8T90_07060 [Planctomycetes bacterium]|nr:hypothetical protein [Planctomycetota bacterium]